MMTRIFLGIMICIGLAWSASTAGASRTEDTSGASAPAGLKYFSDPAYKRLNADDPPPMDEMVDLANQGDTRAMFILGDMSEKGKGGLEKDLKQARHWFEESAKHGYNQSFIRLAALARHENNPKEVWQWYTLAIDGFDDGDAQQYAIKARHDLVDAAKLSSDDTDQARKAMNDWKDARDNQLRAEKDASAEKERLQKEQVEKDAKDGAADSSAATTAASADATDKKPDQQENENEPN